MSPKYVTALVLVPWLLAGASAGAADAERGGAMYDNHCTGCHTSKAHIRERRKAEDMATLRKWVQRWQEYQSLHWSASDVADVAAFLDERYYKFKSTLRE